MNDNDRFDRMYRSFQLFAITVIFIVLTAAGIVVGIVIYDRQNRSVPAVAPSMVTDRSSLATPSSEPATPSEEPSESSPEEPASSVAPVVSSTAPAPSTAPASKPVTATKKEVTVTEPGTYSTPLTYQKMFIKSADAVIKNKTITGDLVIAEEVDTGDVYLENVVVKGTIYVEGGYRDSLHFTDVTAAKMVINLSSGQVGVQLSGKSSIAETVTYNSCTLRASGLDEGAAGFGSVTIEPGSYLWSSVDLLSAYVDTVVVRHPSNIDLGNYSKVGTIICHKRTHLMGDGTIRTLRVYNDNVTYESGVEPDRIFVGEGYLSAEEGYDKVGSISTDDD